MLVRLVWVASRQAGRTKDPSWPCAFVVMLMAPAGGDLRPAIPGLAGSVKITGAQHWDPRIPRPWPTANLHIHNGGGKTAGTDHGTFKQWSTSWAGLRSSLRCWVNCCHGNPPIPTLSCLLLEVVGQIGLWHQPKSGAAYIMGSLFSKSVLNDFLILSEVLILSTFCAADSISRRNHILKYTDFWESRHYCEWQHLLKQRIFMNKFQIGL